MDEIALKIKEIREKKRIKQIEISTALDMNNSFYAKIEKRGKKLTIEQLEAICKELGEDISIFFPRIDNASSNSIIKALPEKLKQQAVKKSESYDLVDMWALIWNNEGQLIQKVFIYGKVNDSNYIVQAINSLSGSPNVAKIVHIDKMTDWTFLPSLEIANEVLADYEKHKTNRFTLSF